LWHPLSNGIGALKKNTRRTWGSKVADETFHKLFLRASRKMIFQGCLPTTFSPNEERKKERNLEEPKSWNGCVVIQLCSRPEIQSIDQDISAQLVYGVENGA
jgi:hypothetical protein